MKIQKTIFYSQDWRWSSYLKYLITKLEEYECKEKIIPSQFSYKESIYGSKKNQNNVHLATWAVNNKRINLARAICINSPSYSVLNFLIIPNPIYNMPFLGVDFVTLPNYHLLVLDFQPSIKIEKQFDEEILDKIMKIKNIIYQKIPLGEKMSKEVASFFSPGLIWSKLPREKSSDFLISHDLFIAFREYLTIYMNLLFNCDAVNSDLQEEIKKGQNLYLDYRKSKDPARPMLKILFGKDFAESLITNVLFVAE